MVPAQSYISINFAGQVEGILGPDDFKSEVTKALGDVPLGVPSFDVTHDDVFWQILSFQFLHYSYQATIVVQTLKDYGSVNDVVSIVTSIAGEVAGQAPSSFQGIMANMPAHVPVVPPDAAAPSPGLLGWVSSALGLNGLGDALQTDITNVLIGAFVLILVLVLVLGYGPNVKKLSTISL